MKKNRYVLFGISIHASSHEEAMDKFKLKNFTKPESTEAYVEELSYRIKNFCNINIGNYSSTKEFVEKLIQAGIIKINPLN